MTSIPYIVIIGTVKNSCLSIFTKGHTLLERYGMTEIGMALTNPLRGPRLAVRCNNHLANHIVSIIIHAF